MKFGAWLSRIVSGRGIDAQRAPEDWRRRSCIQAVRLCAAADDERERVLKKCSEAGIAPLDVLTDVIMDGVDIAEQTSEGVPADFSASEWSDLLQIRKLVDDATAAGDAPLRWAQVRELARAMLDRHGWHGDIDPNQYLV